MLAAQFLNVVLEEKDKTEGQSASNDDESNNNTIYNILSQLEIKSQLAKILLSECTIEPSKIAQKREKPVLSFEANVTPIYETPVKKTKTSNDEFSLINAVEAVYSDGESDDSPTVPCPVCNRSFSRNCSLALHLKSHEPIEDCQRRYQCQLCPRSYSQKSVLKKHFAVHTGERERCKICGAGFSQRSSLVRHAKRIHGGLIGTPKAISSGSPPGQGNVVVQAIAPSRPQPTPILTTALTGLKHPTFGTPLIVGIPLDQLAAGKFAGTPLAGGIVVRSPAMVNSLQSIASTSAQ